MQSLLCDKDDQYTKHESASKGTQVETWTQMFNYIESFKRLEGMYTMNFSKG